MRRSLVHHPKGLCNIVLVLLLVLVLGLPAPGPLHIGFHGPMGMFKIQFMDLNHQRPQPFAGPVGATYWSGTAGMRHVRAQRWSAQGWNSFLPWAMIPSAGPWKSPPPACCIFIHDSICCMPAGSSDQCAKNFVIGDGQDAWRNLILKQNQ